MFEYVPNGLPGLLHGAEHGADVHVTVSERPVEAGADRRVIAELAGVHTPGDRRIDVLQVHVDHPDPAVRARATGSPPPTTT